MSEAEIDNTIIKLMGEIYQVFIDLSYLDTIDVVFPDPQDEGRELPDTIVQLLAELNLSPQVISLLRRLPYIHPDAKERNVYWVEIYPTETQPIDWLDEAEIRNSRDLDYVDEDSSPGRGVLGPNEITLAVPFESMGRHIILDLEENGTGTIRTYHHFDSPEYVAQHRDELTLPFPNNDFHYRNVPPISATEFLVSWLNDLRELEVIPWLSHEGSTRSLSLGPKYWGTTHQRNDDDEGAEDLEGYQKFHINLKKVLVEKYGWNYGSPGNTGGFRREDWARDAHTVWKELDAKYLAPEMEADYFHGIKVEVPQY